MKYLLYLLFSGILILTGSCNKEESNNNTATDVGLEGIWDVVSTSGGFAGISCGYQSGEVVVTFDASDTMNLSLNVLNTTAICGGQELGVTAGIHKFEILTFNDKEFLIVDSIEIGELSRSTDEFTLDQNSASEGAVNDRYFLTFIKQ